MFSLYIKDSNIEFFDYYIQESKNYYIENFKLKHQRRQRQIPDKNRHKRT